MSVVDVAIISILLFNALLGLRRGLVRIVFDLAALFGGLVIGARHYPEISAVILAYLPFIGSYVSLISFALLWLTIFVVVSIIGRLVNRMFMISGFSLLNRFGGLVFGVAKGCFMALPFVVPLFVFNVSLVDSSLFLQPVKPHIQQMIESHFSMPSQDIVTSANIRQ